MEFYFTCFHHVLLDKKPIPPCYTYINAQNLIANLSGSDLSVTNLARSQTPYTETQNSNTAQQIPTSNAVIDTGTGRSLQSQLTVHRILDQL